MPHWPPSFLRHLDATRAWLHGPTYRDLTYATTTQNQDLKLDLYLPFFQTNCPLVIYLHGGGWSTGSYKEAGSRWLIAHGFAVASVQYRLTPEHPFPAQIHDLKAAIRWLRANAITLGYNAGKIGLLGVSSGGHLALLAGTNNHTPDLEGSLGDHLDQDSSIQAIINYFGATDLILRAKTQPRACNRPGSVVHKLLGSTPDENPQLAKLANPPFHLNQNSAPLYLLHGERDPQVKVDQAHRMIDAYQEAKLPIQHDIIKNAGHGGPEFSTNPIHQNVVNFLTEHLS